MFEQTFRNIDDVLWKEAGCTTELDYVEQTSWMLFLKYLDDLERERAAKAELEGKPYTHVIDAQHRWSVWAAPKKADSSFDHDRALTGPDLIEYVDRELFPYLKRFRSSHETNTIEYKIGEIFNEIENKFRSGYSLRDALELIDGLSFRTQDQRHELSALYEDKIKRMGNAGRNGGEYYTPRPLIRAMIKVIDPRIGERIYDGACGSAGFLCEAWDHMRPRAKSTADLEALQTRTFYGKEKKSLAYVIGIMNMILHGIEAPNILHTNTLGENVRDIQEKDRYDVVLANPPFGGKERKEVQANFDVKTGETAFLFLQHFVRSLKAGGRAAIVIKNTFLSNTDNASVSLRKMLLEDCNLHTILDMPQGTFQGAGVKTVVLFFEKGAPTRSIWYYQLDAGRSLGKTNALLDADMAEFVGLARTRGGSHNSWQLSVDELDEHFDLSVRGPIRDSRLPKSGPAEIYRELEDIQRASIASLRSVHGSLNALFAGEAGAWQVRRLGDVAQHSLGKMLDRSKNKGTPRKYLRNINVRWFEFDLSDLLEMRFEDSELDRYSAVRGDLVICEGGYPGRAAIWDGEPILLQKALHRVRFQDPLLTRYFLYYLYYLDLSGALRAHFTGAGIQHFTGQSLHNLKVPLPSDRHTGAIVARLDDLLGDLRKYKEVSARADRLRQDLEASVLAHAFDTPPRHPTSEYHLKAAE